MNKETQQNLKDIKLEKITKMREEGINPYPSISINSDRNKIGDICNKYDNLATGEVTNDKVRVAGRVTAFRNDGMFMQIKDDSGKIQIYTDIKIKKDDIKYIDLGDFILVYGLVRRTPRGELTINTEDVKLVSKAIASMPDKHYGLADQEVIYRKPYLSLLANEEHVDTLLKRSRIISNIRKVLTDELGFLEVETPMLHAIAGGAVAKPFVTYHNALDANFYLRIAPELYLKRLIIGGLSEKIFEINRCFRNEGISTRHNPEFTSMELYYAYANYQDVIDIAELLVESCVKMLFNTNIIEFNGKKLDFTRPWKKVSMHELVKEKTGIDFLEIKSFESAKAAANSIGVHIDKNVISWGKVLEEVFAAKVEDDLVGPIHVTEHPKDISPLSKEKDSDNRLTERFETYINSWEIANGFSELNDPVEQYERFLDQQKNKDAGDFEAHEMDHDFINALEYAMPPTAGLGIGLDRLIMILTNSLSIRNVIAFPTLKPNNN